MYKPKQCITIPARSERIVSVLFDNNDDQICLSRETKQGLFVANTIVRPNAHNIGTVGVLNISNKDVHMKEIELEMAPLSEYYILSTKDQLNESNFNKSNSNKSYLSKSNNQNESNKSNNQNKSINESNNKLINERIKLVLQNIEMSHLNKDEAFSLMNILEKYNHIFYLEGDKLTFTKTIMHRIPLTDNFE